MVISAGACPSYTSVVCEFYGHRPPCTAPSGQGRAAACLCCLCTTVLHHGTWYGTYGTVGMVQARPSYVPYCGRYRSSKNMSQRYVE